MDRFEGINTIPQPVQTNTVPMNFASQTQVEGSVRAEADVEIKPMQESFLPRHERSDERSIADRVEQDALQTGDFDHVFERIANGEYFQNPIEEHLAIEEESVQEETQDGSNYESMEDEQMDFDTRTSEIFNYVGDELRNDTVYQQKIGEVFSEMMQDGQYIDPEVLKEEATRRYIEEKNFEQSKLSLETKVVSIEEQYADLLAQNTTLKKDLADFKQLIKEQNDTMNVLALTIIELVKQAHEKEPDEKKKVTWIEIMIKLMGFLMQEMVQVDEQNGQKKKDEHEDQKTSRFQIPGFTIPVAKPKAHPVPMTEKPEQSTVLPLRQKSKPQQKAA